MKLGRVAIDFALAICTFSLLFLAIFAIQNQISFAMVTSRSMEPTIQAGDIVMSKQIRKSDIQTGDVLILSLPQNRNFKYMHRVIELKQNQGKTIIRTKGDSNPNPDKWLIEVLSPEVPKVFSVLKSGFVFSGPIGRESIFTGLIGSAALLILLAIRRLFPTRSRRQAVPEIEVDPRNQNLQ